MQQSFIERWIDALRLANKRVSKESGKYPALVSFIYASYNRGVCDQW